MGIKMIYLLPADMKELCNNDRFLLVKNGFDHQETYIS